MLDRRQQGIRARRERIVGVARNSLREGSGELSMRQLARDAELSVATLYNLFGGKEAILVAVLDAEIDAIDAALSGDHGLPPVPRAVAIIDASLKHFVSRAKLFRPLLGAIERHGPSQARSALMNRCAAYLLEAIGDGVRCDHFSDDVPADLIARQIMWGYVQAIRYWAAEELTHAQFRAQVRSALALGLLCIARAEARQALLETLVDTAPVLRAISRS